MDKSEDDSDNFLENVECGRTYQLSPRIFRGENTTLGQHPWQAALFQRRLSLVEVLFCGGALLNENFVLTAAHCLDRKPLKSMRVRLGEHEVNGETDHEYPHEVRKIRRKIIHEFFNRSSQAVPVHDIALLQLDRPVKFRKHILPICLPTLGANFAGEIATVTGWGNSKNLQLFPSPQLKKLAVQVVENDECEEWADEFGGHLGLKETHLCAGFRRDGGNTCFTDSGGPLVIEKEGRAQVIGIVSTGIGPFGFVCGMPYFPAIYTNISNYVDWITLKMNSALAHRSHRIPHANGNKCVNS